MLAIMLACLSSSSFTQDSSTTIPLSIFAGRSNECNGGRNAWIGEECQESMNGKQSQLVQAGHAIAEAVAKIIADYRARDAAEKARIAADNPQDQKAQAVAATVC